MVNRLDGRVAAITGASSGLGRAIALIYAKEGASVVCADIRPNARGADESQIPTHQSIINEGGKASFVKTDVCEEVQVEALVACVIKEFGRLDMYAIRRLS